MSKILITGAAGFIGNKLGAMFCKKGFPVIGWDCQRIDCTFPIKKVDMLDAVQVETALKDIYPDIIIHCAGSADVSKSVQNPEADYHGNVTITHNILFAMYKLKMMNTRFVFLSSAGVYGNPISLPITEDMPLNPMSPYAIHKVMCEELCGYFVKNYGMDIKIARIFSAYGAGLKKQIFWDMHKKVQSTGRLDMFGTGEESRDYIHVDDVIQVLYLLATRPSKAVIFNVANGEEVTIRRVTELFADYRSVTKNRIFFNGSVREGDPLNWKADISRIKELGYKKTINIHEGICDYCQWLETM